MKKQALHTLTHHSKSFRFAARLLSEKQLVDVATLYQFCRLVDDIADENNNTSLAEKQLSNIILCLLDPQNHQIDELNDLTILLKKYLIVQHLPITLVEGVKSDLIPARIDNTDSLIAYAYKVAGVVGLMMCPLLQADQKGADFAIDLGIAMQLTNISRDVIEDKSQNRFYIKSDFEKAFLG